MTGENRNENPEENDGEEDEDAAQKTTGGRRRRRRSSSRMGDVGGDGTSNIWLVSFTDVMALMLTFFVLLFSMAEPSEQDWSEITSALQKEFNKYYGSPANRGLQDTVSLNRIKIDQALNLDYLESLLESVIKKRPELETITLSQQPGRLVISMPQEFLFEPSEASVKEEGKKAIYSLAGPLGRIQNKIEVVGHTDPRPIGGEEGDAFQSNWDLSLARASQVAAILKSVGYDKPITVRGAAHGRYLDLEGLGDEEKRMALARRVDIIIMRQGRTKKVFSNSAPQ